MDHDFYLLNLVRVLVLQPSVFFFFFFFFPTSCSVKISEPLHNICFLGAEIWPYLRLGNIISKNNNNTQTHME